MKHNIFRGVLAVEAVACVLFCFLRISFEGIFTAAIAFPFEQIGIGLRTLSLHDAFGNAIAFVIYFFVSLLPILMLFIFSKRRKLNMEDWLLALLSAVLFVVIYLMVNPGIIMGMLGVAVKPPIGKAILGGTVYSLIAGYLILLALRLFIEGSLLKLERYMTIMLGVLNVLFVFLAFGLCFSQLLTSISSLQDGNIGNDHLLGASYFFLVLQYVVNALPYILNAVVIFAALRLLEEMRKERYSTETVEAAEHMSRLCSISLIVTTVTNIIFNLLQLLFARALMVINSSVQIPVMSILFVLAALLLTRFIIESKQLKDENEQFI